MAKYEVFTSEDVPCWISLEEAAVIFHVNLQALYSGVHNTTLPCKRHDDRIIVRASDVEHFKAVHV